MEQVTSSVGKKMANRSNHIIPKIHGLDSPRSTFDGTLTQFKAFAKELRQWCEIYDIQDEQALVIMGQRLKGNAQSMWDAVNKKPNGVTMSLDQALKRVEEDWFNPLALYRSGRDLAKLSFDPSRELSNDFIRKFNELAAYTNEGANQAAVFAG